MNSARLGRSVSESWKAWWRSCCWRSFRRAIACSRRSYCSATEALLASVSNSF